MTTGKVVSIHIKPDSMQNSQGESQDKVFSILKKINAIRESIEFLRNENLDTERIRDQYIIHLQQCQEDHHILKQIYKKLKFKIDSRSPDEQIVAESAMMQNGVQNPQIDGQTLQPSFVQKPALIHAQISPTVKEYSQSPKVNIRLRYALNSSTVVCSAQFSNNGQIVAFADGQNVYGVNYNDGELLFTYQLPPTSSNNHHTRVLKFSPDDSLIALSGVDHDVFLIETQTGRLLHRFLLHSKEVNSIVFNQDGSWMITSGFDGVIIVWDMKTFQAIKNLDHSEIGPDPTIVGIAPASDCSFYAVAFVCGIVGVYDESFSQAMVQFATQQRALMGINVSPLDDSIATASNDNIVKIWMLRAVAKLKAELAGHLDVVLTAEFAPNDNLVFTGSKDMKIMIWNQKNGQPLLEIEPHKNTIFQIDHHPTKKSFVSCSGDGVVCVWDYDD
ncbi:Transcriptional repressor tup12-related protein [Tritrichomonas foetus]|uniref:Transcriptional repressor tup12-related protein n=1 Tax=Tritrichomonas foetus TaxID=1144522 RepID=A0A1J4JYT1_9EUKA|nr:Transcriptional repressor tup12-related protein [Tritrichomonas foetus]|eukprot:OHT03640.1 Transcriptional repressor tup12-related protein [Tritrichomonas foetus]